METKTLKVGDKIARIYNGRLTWVRTVKRVTKTQAIIVHENYEIRLKRDYHDESNLEGIGVSGFISAEYVLATKATKPRLLKLQSLNKFYRSRYELEQLAISLKNVTQVSTDLISEFENLVAQVKALKQKVDKL